ncbi:hypothetical protein AMJ51_01945 [Microgenomates bacterium DG_75]|nr:MAG: hypothetical protein AMJ51_01945 [Microgenomates bacterium DG_75]
MRATNNAVNSPLLELAKRRALVRKRAAKSKKKKANNGKVDSGGIFNKTNPQPSQDKPAKNKVGRKFFLRLITSRIKLRLTACIISSIIA